MRSVIRRAFDFLNALVGRRARAEQDLDDEIEFHLREEERLRAGDGLSRDDAAASAHRAFGNVQLVKERTRETWPAMFLDTLMRDVRFGVRLLTRNAMFAAVSVMTLALGIGAATTIFSVIQNVLFDPFDFNPDRIVSFYIREAGAVRPGGRSAFQPAEFHAYQTQVQSFEEVIGGTTADVLYSTADGTEQFLGGLVSANNFTFLGVPAAFGRAIEPRDAAPDAPPVFVLTHKTWMAHFGGDPAAIGRTFVLNGQPRTLVGVMSPRFQKLAADLYIPSRLDPADPLDRHRYYVLQARLKRGVTEQQAQAEIEAVARRVANDHPQQYPRRFTVQVVRLIDSVVRSFRATLYTLGAAVGLLLLIACANVANMLLARGTTREREMAVRASLGASRTRLVRQMLVESLLLAGLAAALGCVGAHFGVQALAAAIPDGLIPRQAVIRLNTPVLLFSLGIAVVTALVCGLVPAWRVARHDVGEPLKDTGKGGGGGFRHRRLGDALVTAEVALSLVLLLGAGLLVRSFMKLQSVDLGFEPASVVIARMAPPPGQYRTAATQGPWVRQVLTRVLAIPGVIDASTFSTVPPLGPRLEIAVPGYATGEAQFASIRLVSEGYVRTLGLRLRQGRDLTEGEVTAARKVALVNQTLATRYFGKETPLGRTIELRALNTYRAASVKDPFFEIVGVVADVKNQGIQEPALPEVIVPYTVTAGFSPGLMVKTAASPAALLDDLKREVWAVDRSAALSGAVLLTDYLDQSSYAEPRFSLVVMAAFGASGLVLVAIGVFSIIAYTVSRRTHEIGIRMALGAQRRDVARMVLHTTLRIIVLGTVIGLAAGLILTRVFANQLFGVAPQDPLTMAAGAALLLMVGLLASYIPTHQASRVDPMIALRHD
jgi:putative ABC transport system permease protein